MLSIYTSVCNHYYYTKYISLLTNLYFVNLSFTKVAINFSIYYLMVLGFAWY